ncbi:MAG: class I SAM-dependent methyltransferase [Saprospiraceae bacterium]|nr:class I SAM-dependent methyltransferase [Saprospiraceae bacterium]MDW8228975.1 class I SAM-dependent methyltransferase [Saprospiraceae bacterium]
MFASDIYPRLLAYCQAHSTPPDPILTELERYTYLHTLYPQMMSGPLQGRFLTLISQLMRPRRILEVGAFTGYSALCLAQGLAEDGILHTIEANDELRKILDMFVQKANLQHKISIHIGDAEVIVPMLHETFDLIFLDAGKMDYLRHYELVLPKLRAGGLLLADNVLWSGKTVLDPEDETARALRAFNDHVHADERVENLLLPLRDGLMLVRKKF